MFIKFITPIEGVENYNVLFVYEEDEEEYIEVMRGFVVNHQANSPTGIRSWGEHSSYPLPTLIIEQVDRRK